MMRIIQYQGRGVTVVLRCHYSLICLHVDLIDENFLHVDLRGCKFGRKEGGQLFFLLFTPLLFHYLSVLCNTKLSLSEDLRIGMCI